MARDPRFEASLPESLDLDALEALAKKATPGPWRWFGTRGRNFQLATTRWGRRYVMLFDRLGMHGAQPVFQHYEANEQEGNDPLFWGGIMAPAKDLSTYNHNGEVVSIDNADARYIAAISPDVVLKLIEMARGKS